MDHRHIRYVIPGKDMIGAGDEIFFHGVDTEHPNDWNRQFFGQNRDNCVLGRAGPVTLLEQNHDVIPVQIIAVGQAVNIFTGIPEGRDSQIEKFLGNNPPVDDRRIGKYVILFHVISIRLLWTRYLLAAIKSCS